MEFIDLKSQYAALKGRIDARIHAVLEHGQYIMGPEIRELEERLEQYTGARHCIGVANGTDALLIAMMALGITRGDEVITSPFTFIANAEMIALLGATPVFVDIDRDTYNIDPALIEAAITPRTKAIMSIALFGQCADMDAINAIAARHRVPVIDDAAQSFGATYNGKRSGTLADISCTSFFPSKPLGCYGDGGACFTDDDDLATRMRQIRVHGQDRRYHHPVIGLNGRLDTLQAAVLLAKLEVFDAELLARQRVADRYKSALAGVVRTPTLLPGNTSVYAQYTIEVDERGLFVAELKKDGIPTAVHYPLPLNLQPALASLQKGPGSYPHSEAAARHVVSLPLHPYLQEPDQFRICESVKAAAVSRCAVQTTS